MKTLIFYTRMEVRRLDVIFRCNDANLCYYYIVIFYVLILDLIQVEMIQQKEGGY
jgi:hypothetical protein